MSLIAERVALAQAGDNPWVIARLPSGWLVAADQQPLPGWSILLADPVAASLNDLGTTARARYCLDMVACGDALLQATGAERINYQTLCNSEPQLHSHLTPRYGWEEPDKRRMPPFLTYDWPSSPVVDMTAPWIAKTRALLAT